MIYCLWHSVVKGCAQLALFLTLYKHYPYWGAKGKGKQEGTIECHSQGLARLLSGGSHTTHGGKS